MVAPPAGIPIVRLLAGCCSETYSWIKSFAPKNSVALLSTDHSPGGNAQIIYNEWIYSDVLTSIVAPAGNCIFVL
jgi:hypothetical protein